MVPQEMELGALGVLAFSSVSLGGTGRWGVSPSLGVGFSHSDGKETIPTLLLVDKSAGTEESSDVLGVRKPASCLDVGVEEEVEEVEPVNGLPGDT